ncbi:MAG: (d)CMP kinase [Patescibacteria group bacterium]|nr:(d)CMP kinase [Patescibacteria group bacterium]
MKKSFSIAIDGPVGVGKGTLAVALSKKFGALYINTGAMYRTLTLACLREKIDIKNEDQILDLLRKVNIDFKINNDKSQQVFLNGEEVSREIFLPRVSNTVALISPFPQVRREMVKRQREMMKGKDRVVIEGRDITTEVIPDADLKIFLTADLKVRAQRRYKQIVKNKIDATLDAVLAETQERDRRDIERETSPLTVAKDAYVLDTSHLTIDETVKKVIEKMSEKGIV